MLTVNLEKQMKKGFTNPLLVQLLSLQAKYQQEYSEELALYEKEAQRVNAINEAKESVYKQALLDAEKTACTKEDEEILRAAGFVTTAIIETAKEKIEKPVLETVKMKNPVKKNLTDEEQQLLNLYQQYGDKKVCFIPERRIEKVCKNYDLVLSPLKYYRGVVGKKVVDAIEVVCDTYKVNPEKTEFWIAAPRELFDFSSCEKKIVQEMNLTFEEQRKKAITLENPDPLLFVKLEGFYIPVSKWGNDVSILRRIRGFFKNANQRDGNYYKKSRRLKGGIFALLMFWIPAIMVGVYYDKILPCVDGFGATLLFVVYILYGILCFFGYHLYCDVAPSKAEKSYRVKCPLIDFWDMTKGQQKNFKEYLKVYYEYSAKLHNIRTSWKVE